MINDFFKRGDLVKNNGYYVEYMKNFGKPKIVRCCSKLLKIS